MEVRRDVARIADLLERQHIRPERVDVAGILLLKDLAQSQARVEQQVFLLLFRHVLCIFRIIVVAEDVVRHGLDVKARLFVRNWDPLSQLHEVVGIHVLLDELGTALRAGER